MIVHRNGTLLILWSMGMISWMSLYNRRVHRNGGSQKWSIFSITVYESGWRFSKLVHLNGMFTEMAFNCSSKTGPKSCSLEGSKPKSNSGNFGSRPKSGSISGSSAESIESTFSASKSCSKTGSKTDLKTDTQKTLSKSSLEPITSRITDSKSGSKSGSHTSGSLTKYKSSSNMESISG